MVKKHVRLLKKWSKSSRSVQLIGFFNNQNPFLIGSGHCQKVLCFSVLKPPLGWLLPVQSWSIVFQLFPGIPFPSTQSTYYFLSIFTFYYFYMFMFTCLHISFSFLKTIPYLTFYQFSFGPIATVLLMCLSSLCDHFSSLKKRTS